MTQVTPNILRGETDVRCECIDWTRDFAGGYAGLSFRTSRYRCDFCSQSPATDVVQAHSSWPTRTEVDGTYAWGYIALGGCASRVDGDAVHAGCAAHQALTLAMATRTWASISSLPPEAALGRSSTCLRPNVSAPTVGCQRQRAPFMVNAQFMSLATTAASGPKSTESGPNAAASDFGRSHTRLLDRPQEAELGCEPPNSWRISLTLTSRSIQFVTCGNGPRIGRGFV